MRNRLHQLLFINFFIAVGCFSCKNDAPIEQDLTQEYDSSMDEPGSMMIQYKDSLTKYFGALEIDLIRQYKINYESLADEIDFYTFYRNANTLRRTLVKTLNRHASERVANNQPLLSFKWFEELAKGYQVYIVNEERSYAIHFDYSDLEEHAQLTEGLHDDEFINLLELAYDSLSHINKWTIQTRKDSYCSKLGSGKHYDILKQANVVLEHSKVFYKEIHKIQIEVINDILFAANYCNTPDAAMEEIERIINEVEFKGKEVELLNVRLKQLKAPEEFNINFNCSSADCPATAVAIDQNA